MGETAECISIAEMFASFVTNTSDRQRESINAQCCILEEAIWGTLFFLSNRNERGRWSAINVLVKLSRGFSNCELFFLAGVNVREIIGHR